MEFELLAARICKLEKEVEKLKDAKKIKKEIEIEVEGGAPPAKKIPRADEYRKFVTKINKEPFMKKYKGKGKRKIQSLLYELKNDFKADGLNGTEFEDYLENLDKNLGVSDFKNITDDLVNFRDTFNWVNGGYKKSKKKIEL